MLSQFITVTGWLALLMIVGGLVQLLLKPTSRWSPQLLAAQVLGAVSGIFVTVGVLVREVPSVSIPLSLLGTALAILAITLRIRHRAT